MIVIRLSRHGAKRNPFYHVVVANKTEARDGRFIEKLGFYNPSAKGKETELEINLERVDEWVKKGAQLSERVAQVLKDHQTGRTQVKAEKKAKKTEVKRTKQKAEAKAKAATEQTEKAEAEATSH